MVVCEIKKQLKDFDLNLSFKLGNETLVIVGQSGCGKSTTLKALAGLVLPDQGRIQIGQTIYFDHQLNIHIPPEDRGLGLLFQNYALFPHLTVFENVAYGLAARKVPKKEQRSRVADTLEALKILHLIDRFPSELSGGEQQRVALARALILKPALFLLDEPLAALDVTTRSRVRSELKKILTALKIPTIIVTHDYEDAISFGERILVMDKGRVIQEGTAHELLTQPRSSFVADFSGTNYFAAHILEKKDSFLHLALGNWDERLLSTQSISQSLRGAEKKEIYVMIYPWDIQLNKKQVWLSSSKSIDTLTNIIEGRIINILSYGNRATIEMEGSIPLIIEVTSDRLEELKLRVGDLVFAKIDPFFVNLL